jgi:hypothetical protein
VASANEQQDTAKSSRAPRSGVRLMIIIVVAMALLAIYANVQKARRKEIEKVTIIPVAISPSATPSPAN